MTSPVPQQPMARRVDLTVVVAEQGATIGAMSTQLLMANLELEAANVENAKLRERLAGYENDTPADTDSDDEAEAEARASVQAELDNAADPAAPTG